MWQQKVLTLAAPFFGWWARKREIWTSYTFYWNKKELCNLHLITLAELHQHLESFKYFSYLFLPFQMIRIKIVYYLTGSVHRHKIFQKSKFARPYRDFLDRLTTLGSLLMLVHSVSSYKEAPWQKLRSGGRINGTIKFLHFRISWDLLQLFKWIVSC